MNTEIFYLMKEEWHNKYQWNNRKNPRTGKYYYYNGHGFETYAVIDSYSSVLWAERYDEPGEFEIKMPYIKDVCYNIELYDYIFSPLFENYMIIENIKAEFNDSGDMEYTISGRSLESLLERRVTGIDTVFKGYIEDGCRQIVNHCFKGVGLYQEEGFSHESTNLSFEYTYDNDIRYQSCNHEFSAGDTCLHMISTLAKSANLGLKVTLDLANAEFIFKLTKSVNHSADQNVNPTIIFSKDMDNISSTSHEEVGGANHKDAVYVKGHYAGKGNYWEMDYVIDNIDSDYTGTGRKRYMLSEDFMTATAQSESYDDYGNKVVMDSPDYRDLLQKEADKEYKEHSIDKSTDAKIFDKITFTYKKDYQLGDIVQVEDVFGFNQAMQIYEYVYTCDSNGVESYPSLREINTAVSEE